MLKFFKDWMLPIAIVLGIVSYMILYLVPALAENVEPGFSVFAKNIQPVLMAIMLFLQFNKISPHDLRFRKWHFVALVIQVVLFVVFAWVAVILPDGTGKILAECAMLCFVCPTAAAAGVITNKLGGSLSDTVSYVVLINVAAAFIIPLVIPLFNSSPDATFFRSFSAICMKIFPLLVMPLLVAWLIRYTVRPLQRWLMRYADWAFYVWGGALTFAIYLATRALVTSRISVWGAMLIALVSLACTLIQFAVGRAAGRMLAKDEGGSMSDAITAGQALGQKNSGFLIWLGYSYLTPVTSVAGGLYSIWQNLINSLELFENGHKKK